MFSKVNVQNFHPNCIKELGNKLSSVLARTYRATNVGIRQAVEGLRCDLQFQRDLKREVYHRCLVVVKHTGAWSRFRLNVWVTEVEALL